MGRRYVHSKWQMTLVLALVLLLSGSVVVLRFIPAQPDVAAQATATATLTAAGPERERIQRDLADVHHMQPRQIVVSDFSPDRPHRLAVNVPATDGNYHTPAGITLPRAAGHAPRDAEPRCPC